MVATTRRCAALVALLGLGATLTTLPGAAAVEVQAPRFRGTDPATQDDWHRLQPVSVRKRRLGSGRGEVPVMRTRLPVPALGAASMH